VVRSMGAMMEPQQHEQREQRRREIQRAKRALEALPDFKHPDRAEASGVSERWRALDRAERDFDEGGDLNTIMADLDAVPTTVVDDREVGPSEAAGRIAVRRTELR